MLWPRGEENSAAHPGHFILAASTPLSSTEVVGGENSRWQSGCLVGVDSATDVGNWGRTLEANSQRSWIIVSMAG